MPVAAIAVAIDRIMGCKHYENSRHSNFSIFNVFSKECFALMALKAHYWALWSWERTIQTCFCKDHPSHIVTICKSHWHDLRHRVLLSQLCHRLTRCIVGTIVTQAYLICIVGTEETDSGNLHATMESLPSRVVLFTIIFITRTLYFADIELAEKQTRSQTFKSWKTETATSSFWWLQSKILNHPG